MPVMPPSLPISFCGVGQDESSSSNKVKFGQMVDVDGDAGSVLKGGENTLKRNKHDRNKVPTKMSSHPSPLHTISKVHQTTSNPSFHQTLVVPPLKSPGLFHPEFMFCGYCTACHEENTTAADTGHESRKEQMNQDALLSISNSGDDSDDEAVALSDGTIQTTFLLRQGLTTASQALVVQSLLQPISGVNSVTIPELDAQQHQNQQRKQIVVQHDASINIETIIKALKVAGHLATVESKIIKPFSSEAVPVPSINTAKGENIISANSPSASHHWVRSSFYVQGICCASEIPAVRKIVKALPGVSRLNINLTTKVVHVQHDIHYTQASDIALALSTQGFLAQIRKDGFHMAQVNHQARSSHDSKNLRTTLHVQGVLQDRDVATLQSTLSSLDGVTKINIIVSEGVIYVDHETQKISSHQCADFVMKQFPQFPCSVAVAAETTAGDAVAAALDSIGRSRYVESTLRFEGLAPYHVPKIETAIKKNFIRAQVRAVYPCVSSETVKVEHDPKLVSASNICQLLQNSYSRGEFPSAEITIDGADDNLYLPLQEDYAENRIIHREEPSLLKVHANVWLSGFFWLLSMISYVDGKDWFKYFGLASVLFGLPTIAIKAIRTVRRYQFDANCMMVTAAVGALGLGEYDEAASVAFLFAISEYLEASATSKARKALEEICAMRPDHANVIHPVSKEIVVVPADRVPLGSILSVRTGDKIATDGIVLEGSSAVDESNLTGESSPVSKNIGDVVSGGTINVGQTQLVIRTTSTVEDSAVSRLIRLVEEAQSNRSPTEKMIDAFARSYTPTVMLMAALMCTVPWAFGAEIGRHWTLNGLIIIVIACPCALTISTPVTYAAGLAATAQRGIIVKGGSKLEAMGSVDRVVFDKTGTLTKGTFSVTHLEATNDTTTSRQQMLELLALMQERSSHPLAPSLVNAVKQEGVVIPHHLSISNHQLLKGEGITALVDGKTQVYVGNKRLFLRLGMFDSLASTLMDRIVQWESTGGTVGFIGSQDDGIFGMFCVKDEVREDARSVIDELRNAGIETLICTGDSDSAAQAVAKEIGIPAGCVNSQLLPEEKLHLVGSLKRPQPRSCGICRQQRYVLFCGDGVNDAPALAVADVGVSMGEGAAMALELSDVTLMDSRLEKLTYALKMGKRVKRTVIENISISLLAKLAVVILTFAGRMTLLYAIASDVGIMLLVTLNGMKLLPTMSLLEIWHLNKQRKWNSSQDYNLVGSNVADQRDLTKAEIIV